MVQQPERKPRLNLGAACQANLEALRPSACPAQQGGLAQPGLCRDEQRAGLTLTSRGENRANRGEGVLSLVQLRHGTPPPISHCTPQQYRVNRAGLPTSSQE